MEKIFFKIKLVLFSIFILYNSSNGQLFYNTWVSQNIFTSNNINSISYNPPSKVFIMTGNNGYILRSTDYGDNWTNIPSNTSNNLYNVCLNTIYYLSVGQGGTIILSTNNGIIWYPTNSPTNEDLNYVCNYVMTSWFIAVGNHGVVFLTKDFGNNWDTLYSGVSANLKCMSVSPENYNVGYIVGNNGTVLRIRAIITPERTSFNYTSLNTGIFVNYNSVLAPDSATAIAVGQGGKIVRTTNSGVTWTELSSTTTNDLFSITQSKSNEYVACGSNGTIIRTTNGGNTWFSQPSNTSENLLCTAPQQFCVGNNGKLVRYYLPPNLEGTHNNTYTTLDYYNIKSFLWNTGVFNQDIRTYNNAGFEWPKNSGKKAVYTSGLTIASKVNGILKFVASSYRGEYTFGSMINQLPSGNQNIGVYKISKGDNCYNSVSYANWGQMVPFGAPYIDVNHNGQYDPCIDTPGVKNAAQTIFLCLTDGYTFTHSTLESFGGGTQPLFADLRVTAWVYSDSSLADVQYIKWDVINKGTTTWNNLFFTIFSDPDLGEPTDDYFGCDTIRNLGYCYNGTNYDIYYGANPPAVGFRLLRGPINKNDNHFDTLKMTSLVTQLNAGLGGIPPCEWDAGNPLQAYNFMRGYKNDSISPWMNPLTNPPAPTKFCYSGDPETNEGWIETKGCIQNCGGTTGNIVTHNTPGDRRVILNSGKENLTMQVGEKQTIVIAQLIARGTSNLNSVTKLKQLSDLAAEYYYASDYTPPEPVLPIDFRLHQNYPNPFNVLTTIEYDIKEQTNVSLKVYDLLGKEIATLVNGNMSRNFYKVTFNGNYFASGVYFYRLKAGDYTEVKKMMLIK